MDDNTLPAGGLPQSSARPTMLTVLCILTFISVGLGLLGSILGAVGLSFLGDFGGGGFAGAGLALLIPGLILVLGRGVGAFMMWQLKKLGFFIYAGITAVEVLIWPFVVAAILGVDFTYTISWFAIALGVVFVGLYYTNLKAMK